MVVVVTGASKGIGKAVAERFASAGHTLVLCARNQQKLDTASETIALKYPNSIIYHKAVDISVKDEVTAFAAWALQTAGTPAVLVNNAAWFINSSLHSEEDGVLDKMLATNLYGAYHLTRAMLPGMMANKAGHIFNICSTASFTGTPDGGSYSISKFALTGFTKNLREEMKPYGIKVTGVYPGSVHTESWEGSGVIPSSLIQAVDIADLIYTTAHLSSSACVEDIFIKPQDRERYA